MRQQSQDEELEQLLGEIPSSAGPDPSTGSTGDEKPHFGHFYPIPPENLPQPIRSGEPPPGGAAHIDAGDGDISAAFWKLNLNGKIPPDPRDFHPTGAFPLRTPTPATPARFVVNPALNQLGAGGFQRGLRQEEVIRFIHNQLYFQQQEQARVLEQNLGLNIPPRKIPGYSAPSYYPHYYPNGRDEHPGVCRYKFPQPAYVEAFNFPPASQAYYQQQHKVRGSIPGDDGDHHYSPSLNARHHQQQPFNGVEELKGRMYELAKDQHGCRFLQKKYEEDKELSGVIFEEIIDHVAELMTDPFGNYLVQKVLERCDESQRDRVVGAVTCKSQLVHISLNMHGTRAVQKLIETLETPEQVSMVVASLKPGVVMLVRDTNGNHVIQRCLVRLGWENNQFIYDAATAHCVEIAGHRHGCVVLQRCVDSAPASQRDRIVAEITANSLILAQDAYGNYVVQYILDKDKSYSWAKREVMLRLSGKFAQLAMQKFSSNVVEKCLKEVEEEQRGLIVRELITSASFDQLLHHEYANYVIQCALTNTKGVLHGLMVDAIRPHIPALRSSPYGKRILSRIAVSRK